MQFSIEKSIEILERTPLVIEDLLGGISEEWVKNNEGPQTWSPYDIVGHLIHGEKTDWIPRMEIILSDKKDKTFDPFDRFAQFKISQGQSIVQLLDEFKKLRKQNIEHLRGKKLKEQELEKKGNHPDFGEVTLKQLLAAWVAHDLNHIVQISRVMAKQYKTEIGPWKDFMGVMKN